MKKTKYLMMLSFIVLLAGLSLTVIGLSGFFIALLSRGNSIVLLAAGLIVDLLSFIFLYSSYRKERASSEREEAIPTQSERDKSHISIRDQIAREKLSSEEETGEEMKERSREEVLEDEEAAYYKKEKEAPSVPAGAIGGLSADANKDETIKKKKPKLAFKKHISVEYYDFMNPEKSYPMNINLSDIEQHTIEEKENILTAEHSTQLKDKMDVKLTHPIITVHPILPGCIITPSTLQSDLLKFSDEITFFVTPIAKGTLEGYIDFLNAEGKIIHSLPINAQVEDPRLARSVAVYGAVMSIIPKALTIFGINLGEILTNILAMVGVLFTFVLSYFIFKLRQPKKTKQQAKLK
jgi:hypothetical protein